MAKRTIDWTKLPERYQKQVREQLGIPSVLDDMPNKARKGVSREDLHEDISEVVRGLKSRHRDVEKPTTSRERKLEAKHNKRAEKHLTKKSEFLDEAYNKLNNEQEN